MADDVRRRLRREEELPRAPEADGVTVLAPSSERRAFFARRNSSTWAESSFLPAWRAMTTVKERPRRPSADSTMARPGRHW